MAASTGDFDAVVTAPLQKSSINEAGIPFSGHTEFFAERAGREVVMMLASPDLRVTLATTHLPLSAVPAAVTAERLAHTLRIVDRLAQDSTGSPVPALPCSD